MKNNQSITIASAQYNPVIEAIIKKKDEELKNLARKNGRHHAKRNRPDPVNDKLDPFTGELKTGSERLAADILHLCMPKSQFPQGKMDIDYYKEKDKKLDEEIKLLEDKNRHDEYDLENYSHGSLNIRIWITAIFTFIIMLGEIIFNTKAFQVIGDNKILALILAITVSFAVFVFSHIASFMYKAAPTPFKRRIVLAGSLVTVTVLFIALAIFRSTYLASNDVHVSPVYFVIINLFFFIVSALLSFFLLPTWPEVKEHFKFMKLQNAINRRKDEIQKYKQEKEKNKEIINEITKVRLQLIYYSNYVAERIRKLYFESLEIFKSTNLVFRTDGKTPQCFHEIPAEPDIENVMLYINPVKDKPQ
jgi:cation transport ATPase